MKGNPILGTGSGSIGDVTIMRRNGSQVTRVRLRKIKNPMSQGQAEQRMYMAPILKFYSPLAKVLETSFEGLNKADSYSKFISVNANLARANGWAVKKGSGFVALPYQVAGGSLAAPQVSYNNNKLTLEIGPTDSMNFGGVSAAIISKYGLQNGDQLTFIIFNGQTLVYHRIYLDTTSQEGLPEYLTLESTSLVVNDATCAAVIFSRWEEASQKWARSNSFMVCATTYLANYTGDENLAAAISSYMKGAGKTPVSDVYLNGSDE